MKPELHSRGRAWLRAGALALGAAALLASGLADAQKPARWVRGELLVGFRAGVGPTALHAFLRRHGATYVNDVGRRIRVVRIRVPAASEDAVIRRLERLPQVKFIEKNYEFTPALLPDDPSYPDQWHLPQILADQAWDLTQGGADGLIAILDSGIDSAHPDLAGKLVPGYNTYSGNTDTSDAYGHGTQVAGVAGAATNNAEGVAGIAGASPLMPVRVTSSTGTATAASIADGIVWAADHGARVVNLSFNGVAGNATIRAAAEYAYNLGTLVVAASGNCACADPTAETPFILSVSATDEGDGLAGFSSTGAYVDLSAPGTDILTTDQFGLYFPYSGTSFASPIVAGVASLLYSANPAMTPQLASLILESTAVDRGGSGYDTGFGYGRVDAWAAVALASGYVPPVDVQPPTIAMTTPVDGDTVSGDVVVDVSAEDDTGVTKVDLFVDNVFYDSETATPYTFAWSAGALENGGHTLQAIAYDAAGNSAATTPIVVTVANVPPDTTPPAVSITAPAPGSTVSGIVTVTADASDGAGVVATELYVDGVLTATDSTAPYALTWNTTASQNGPHTLEVFASDAAGNVSNAAETVNVANNVQHAPVARDDAYSAPYRPKSTYTARVLAVLANDTDADGDLKPSTVTITRAPDRGGTVTVRTNGKLAYKPKRLFKGIETFDYTVKDKNGATSNIATVTITVQ